MAIVAKKIKSKWDALNASSQKLASLITALCVIGGAFFGTTNYIVSQFDLRIQSQMSDVRKDVAEIKLSSTRNELLLMMKNNPENVTEIEKIARKYFKDMDGDWYMSGLYSKWCKAHGGDASFVIE